MLTYLLTYGLQGKAAQFEEVKGKPVLKGEEFRKYASELRGKTAQYKRMKQELGELRAEHGVLARTQAILQQEANKVSGILGGEEARRGLSGYQEPQDELEKVSQQKADIDETKGKTLEEIEDMFRAQVAASDRGRLRQGGGPSYGTIKPAP